MKTLLVGLSSLALVTVAFVALGSAEAAAAPLKFGMDSSSISAQAGAGVKPDYGTFWIGPWTLSSGWAGPDAEMANMRSAGVTPAIHFYYWGDDISPSCVENGCWSDLHNSQKTRAGWQRLAEQLASHMNAKMGGQPVVVFLESEFNKGGIQTYEPFDGYMAAMADYLHAKYPAAIIVLPFGNWGPNYWGNFDRAAAATDLVGLQGMRGSSRDSLTTYHNLYEATLSGSLHLKKLFGKPILLHDIALSSHPEPEYLKHQADALRELFGGVAELKGAGVMGIIYRSWRDSPGMDLGNYYGEAERHWGLVHVPSAGGAAKPAARVWIDAVKAERAHASPPATSTSTAATSTSTSSAFTASFAPSSGVNEWWVDVKVTSSQTPSKVEARVNSGAWNMLSKTDWGTWAKSMNAPKGSSVVFKATNAAGATVTSAPFQWLGAAPSPTTTSSTAFTASFQPASSVNEWWIDVKVTSSQAPSKVEARVNSGAWNILSKTDWGTWAKSINAPKGSSVVFKATNAAGATVTSAPFQWLGAAPSPTTTSSTSFKASFAPKGTTNNWWVEVAVSATGPIAKIEARENGGAWTVLSKTDWGTYAKSFLVEDGHRIEFRATSTTGATSLSGSYTWS